MNAFDFNPHFVVQMFSMPIKKNKSHAKALKELEESTRDQIQEITDASLATIDEVLKQKEKKIKIKINAFAPNIVVPEVSSSHLVLLCIYINPNPRSRFPSFLSPHHILGLHSIQLVCYSYPLPLAQ